MIFTQTVWNISRDGGGGGDPNSNYMVSHRRNRNVIDKLELESLGLLEDSREIEKEKNWFIRVDCWGAERIA